jgi:hypothetical protein
MKQTFELNLSNFIDSLEFDPDKWILREAFLSDSISQDLQKDAPDYFILSQNYPNPFNQMTTIEFILSKSGQVKLTVYNTLGKKVKSLIDNYKNAGKHIQNFNASFLASGVYYYVLKYNRSTQTKKMILIR